MKSNYLSFFYLQLILMISSLNALASEEFNFKAKNIQTISKDLIIATQNVNISDNFGNNIFADKLEINKQKLKHKITGNVRFFDNSNNRAIGEILIIDEKNNLATLEGNVVLINEIKQLEINTDKIKFNLIDNTLLTGKDTKIVKDKIYILNGGQILFDKNKETLASNDNSILFDDVGNKIEIRNFILKIKENSFLANNVKIVDKNLYEYELNNIFYDFKKKEILGKDAKINYKKELQNLKAHLPRSKSKSFKLNKDNLILSKSVYTNCKKRDGCPPWLLKAEEVNHDKKNNIVNYKKATLSFYNFPVLYFPKFFHPDPTVKRQSGFLTPSFNSKSNKNNYLSTPYYMVLSESSDFTFSPRIYDNLNNLYQGEYRKVTKNSKHTLDFSVQNESPIILKNNSTKTHLFLETNINFDKKYFDKSNLNIKLQNVSNEKYLKESDISSSIIDSKNLLNSEIKFNGFNDNQDFTISAELFEDLTKNNTSDRYEVILPNFEYIKNSDLNDKGSISFISNGYGKLYDTNVNEKVIINDFEFKSFDKINYLGFVKNYEFIIKNFNSSADNSKVIKNKLENNLEGLLQFNYKYPMIKYGEFFNSRLTPKVALKINPFKNKNINSNGIISNYSNIFSIDRIASNKTLESGQSLTIGNEFKILDKKQSNYEIFSQNLGISLREKQNSDLPSTSSLGNEISNLFGSTKFKMNNFIDFNYDYLIDKNFNDINYHNLSSSFRINNFITKFEFLEENNFVGQESFISNETKLDFNKNTELVFKTRKNKKTNLREYYNLIYQFKMDCLTAGIEYNKNYYSDGLIKPDESVKFTITFMPFESKINSPIIYK